MRILLAGGGTGGHINPAIAIANTVKQKDKAAKIAFIGTKNGLENRLVTAAGYPIYHIEMRGLRRSLSLANLLTAYYYLTAPKKAKKLLLDFAPDVVVGTGGYLSWPLLHAAAKLGIPTAVHESNAIPGKAVKMLEKEVDRVYTSFPSTAEHLKAKEKILRVGNPLISPPASPRSPREALDLPEGTKKIVLSFGGSLGSERINEEILTLMASLSAKDKSIFHIHATGKNGYEKAMERAKTLGLCDCENIRLTEYLYDIPAWEAAADAVICRAGAMTISELALLRRPAILIPSPNVTDNHQYENAKRLSEAGAAILLEEKYLTPSALYDSVCDILINSRTAARLSENIGGFADPDAAESIYRDLRLLANRDLYSLLKKNK